MYVVAVLSKWRQFVCDAEHAFAEQCACKTTIRFSLIRQHTRARTHRLVAFSFFVHSYSIHIDISEGLLYKSIILNGSLSDERFFFIKKKLLASQKMLAIRGFRILAHRYYRTSDKLWLKNGASFCVYRKRLHIMSDPECLFVGIN